MGDPTQPWVRSREACHILRVSNKTLSEWARRGQIHSLLLPGRGQRQHRLYDVSSILSAATATTPKSSADTGNGSTTTTGPCC